MKYKALVLLCVGLLCMHPMRVHAAKEFNKAAFYSVMASGELIKIDHEIEVVQNAAIDEKQGYEGALLMRKAGLVPKSKDRLKYFKEGRIKFDGAILANADNGEYHFLRLTIQEHAPNAVKYKGDLEKDKQFIIQHFKNMPAAVQKAIVEYSKNSGVLHREDFNFG
ncbi:MAG: hypothetical protein P4L41_15060 [Flavipsychrobacter sp.]|nr:hypothetical protein [Flavipsychrobacter sp.]